jgi:hypothetical protein
MKKEVTETLRQEILRVYKAEGPTAAAAFCAEKGLSRGYYSALACRRGVAVKKSKPLTAAQKAAMRQRSPVDDSHDKRWQWAIERGPVVA